MISTCPECGRSYPTHHGKICKMCAAKKAGTPLPSAEYARKGTQPLTLNPDLQEAKTVSPNASRTNLASSSQTLSSGQPQKASISPAAALSSVTPPAEQDTTARKVKKCPHCEFENDATDVFCFSCKKMLFKSVGEQKIVDFPLSKIKGTIPDHLAKLKKLGIETTLYLLDKGSSPIKRKTLNIKTGISDTFLVRMINQSDLLRVPSIEPENSFLLEMIGINSLKLLEKKTGKEIVDLIIKNKPALQGKNILVYPDENKLTKWIEEAKLLEKIVL